MRTYRFYQVDVFTDKAFGGNPLAVFPDAEGLSDREMQQLAREMNLSETTFVLPSADPKADFRVRIFTPAAEVPLAGHPVVGTHYVLASLGRIHLKSPVTRIHQELKVGILPVDLYVEGGAVQRVVMTQVLPSFLTVVDDLAATGRCPGGRRSGNPRDRPAAAGRVDRAAAVDGPGELARGRAGGQTERGGAGQDRADRGDRLLHGLQPRDAVARKYGAQPDVCAGAGRAGGPGNRQRQRRTRSLPGQIPGDSGR